MQGKAHQGITQCSPTSSRQPPSALCSRKLSSTRLQSLPPPYLRSMPSTLASSLGSLPPPPRHSPTLSAPCLQGRRQHMRHGTIDPHRLDLGAGPPLTLTSSPQIPTSKDAINDSAHESPTPRPWSRPWIPDAQIK
jgi:hypothetical protein